MDNEKWFGFYGVCHNKFKLDDVVWEAIEDPDDGYRSCLDAVKAVKEDDCTFFHEPVATVKVIKVEASDFDGYHLVDKSGHVWLKVGTDTSDSYYPCFIVQYDPPKYLTANFDDLVSEADNGTV
jgi:hypothetical protein